MGKAKKEEEEKNPLVDCRGCKQAGPEKNFMCYCNKLMIYRSVGKRICGYLIRK